MKTPFTSLPADPGRAPPQDKRAASIGVPRRLAPAQESCLADIASAMSLNQDPEQ